ncbi:HTH-type transcriptional regulator CdhR [Roseovarius sp. THAF9]|uniref:GlxA family transcriptional regulator n=1 Tax=Roseovarius sp. THAF9 TaxID=2587847 RepID=UPI001269222D|nr:helix-turn-helix domain-containing protein [Roseovarius sp. THAF9]QFT91693.1 HTH-type transcriptional regulator CdhR [Roseovarius sp. THAF9]
MARSRDKLHVVVVLVNEGHASTAVSPIEIFSSAGTMFEELRGKDPDPRFRVTTASIDGRSIETAHGLRITPDCAIDETGPADLVIASASGPVPSEWMARHAALVPWLIERYDDGCLVAGVCSGVAFLAEAGLLDGRRATTYWGVADAFRARYPAVDWRTDLLITEDAGIFCGGGVNAAADLSLYLVERLCGHRVAVECSRALLLDMPRQDQTGYAILPLARPHGDDRIRMIEDHLSANFQRDVSVEELAERAGMSRRTLMRRFKAATNVRPGTYHQMLRIAASRRMLEEGAASIQQVSTAVGYEDAAFFRRVFKRHCGMTPAAYRDRFGTRVL